MPDPWDNANGGGALEPPAAPPKRRRHRWLWIIAFAFLVLIVILFLIYHRSGAPTAKASGRMPANRVVPVTTATATSGNIGVYLDAIGTVTPVYTDQITSQQTGVINQVHFAEGQYVHKGDPLIDLDARQYEAQLEQAQGALERDKNLLAQAQMDLARYQQAWARNGIARQQLEDQQSLVKQYEGTVRNDEGTVRYQQVQVEYCHITAPIDGRVGLRLVDPGNLVTANATTPLVVITQMQPITVVFTLSEDNLGSVLSQMKVQKTLSVEAWDRQMKKKQATGALETVDNQIDTTTGTVKLRAGFPNKDNALFPNEFVNTRLLVKTLHNQILIPSSAVQHNGDQSFVFVINNGEATIVNVKTGISEGGMTAVQGIKAGDVVANSSFDKLQNGSKITISTVPLPTSGVTSNAP
jgi:multidrug efflux system membrane fusion protein